MRALVLLLCLSTTGCAIAAKSDRFGADLDVSLGGLIGFIADVRVKASVGFSKTCKENDNAHADDGPDDGLLRVLL